MAGSGRKEGNVVGEMPPGTCDVEGVFEELPVDLGIVLT